MGASFVRENLKGRSLAGRDLTGADFTGSDLRGADLSGADLRGAVFRGARMGLPLGAVVGRVAAGILLGAASGFAASWTGAWIRAALSGPRVGLRVLAVVVLSEILLYALATLLRGSRFAIEHVALPVFAIIVTGAVVVLAGRLGGLRDLGLAMTAAACVVVVALAIGTGALARAYAQSGANWLIGFVLAGTVIGVRLSSGLGVAVVVAVVATVAGFRARRTLPLGGVASAALVRTMSVGGTSFRDANLEDADFGGATMRNTDFRGARIDGTRWNDPLQVDFCRFDAGAHAPSPRRGTRGRR